VHGCQRHAGFDVSHHRVINNAGILEFLAAVPHTLADGVEMVLPCFFQRRRNLRQRFFD